MPRIGNQIFRTYPIDMPGYPAIQGDDIAAKSKALRKDLAQLAAQKAPFEQSERTYARIVQSFVELEKKCLAENPPLDRPKDFLLLRREIGAFVSQAIETLQPPDLFAQVKSMLQPFGESSNDPGVKQLLAGLRDAFLEKQVMDTQNEYGRFYTAVTLIEMCLPVSATPMAHYEDLSNPELWGVLTGKSKGVFVRAIGLQNRINLELEQVTPRSDGEKALHHLTLARIWASRMNMACICEQHKSQFPYSAFQCREEMLDNFISAVDMTTSPLAAFTYASELLNVIPRTRRFDLLAYVSGVFLATKEPPGKRIVEETLKGLGQELPKFQNAEFREGKLASASVIFIQALLDVSQGKQTTVPLSKDFAPRIFTDVMSGPAAEVAYLWASLLFRTQQALARLGKVNEARAFGETILQVFSEVKGQEGVLGSELMLGVIRASTEVGHDAKAYLKILEGLSPAATLSDVKLPFSDPKVQGLFARFLQEVKVHEAKGNMQVAGALRARALNSLSEIEGKFASRRECNAKKMDLGGLNQLRGVFSSNPVEKRGYYSKALEQFTAIKADNNDKSLSADQIEAVSNEISRLSQELKRG